MGRRVSQVIALLTGHGRKACQATAISIDFPQAVLAQISTRVLNVQQECLRIDRVQRHDSLILVVIHVSGGATNCGLDTQRAGTPGRWSSTAIALHRRAGTGEQLGAIGTHLKCTAERVR